MPVESRKTKVIHVISVANDGDLLRGKDDLTSFSREPEALVLVDFEELRAVSPALCDTLCDYLHEAKEGGVALQILSKKEGLRERLPETVFKFITGEFPFRSSFRSVLEREFSYDRPVKFHISLPCKYKYLSEMRRFFYEIVNRRFEESDSFKVALIMDELCLNAVENSRSDRSRFDIEWFLANGTFTATVSNTSKDSGGSLEKMRRLLNNFDDSGSNLSGRGRGLYLVKEMSDGISLDPGREERDRIFVTVEKRLTPR